MKKQPLPLHTGKGCFVLFVLLCVSGVGGALRRVRVMSLSRTRTCCRIHCLTICGATRICCAFSFWSYRPWRLLRLRLSRVVRVLASLRPRCSFRSRRVVFLCVPVPWPWLSRWCSSWPVLCPEGCWSYRFCRRSSSWQSSRRRSCLRRYCSCFRLAGVWPGRAICRCISPRTWGSLLPVLRTRRSVSTRGTVQLPLCGMWQCAGRSMNFP